MERIMGARVLILKVDDGFNGKECEESVKWVGNLSYSIYEKYN